MPKPDPSIHSAAELVPRMTEECYEALRDDIAQNGLLVPIQRLDGAILDGRHRYRACQELGIAPRYEDLPKGDPYAAVLTFNLRRRDLTADQRYLIWVDLTLHSVAWQEEQAARVDEANRKRSEAAQQQPRAEDGTFSTGPGSSCTDTGSRDYGAEEQARARTARATASATNVGTVARMDRLRIARPDLAAEVKAGKLKGAQARRIMHRDGLADRIAALPPGVYRVLYADPPWKYGSEGIINDSDAYGRAERHYPTMSIGELCALDVRSIAADDAVLFLWVTSPMLEEAMSVVTAWGFEYKTNFVWDKVQHNFGHYNSVRHEFLFVCTRGSCLPDSGELVDSVIEIDRSKIHSQKPEQFRQIIDRLYPMGPRIELFARTRLPGWECHGLEAPEETEASEGEGGGGLLPEATR